MGIAAVTSFVVGGVAVGTVAAIVALREGERPGVVALGSSTAIAVASGMLIHWLFWSSLGHANWQEALMPNFFSPGRKEQILIWYGLWSAGAAGLVVATCGSFLRRDRQA